MADLTLLSDGLEDVLVNVGDFSLESEHFSAEVRGNNVFQSPSLRGSWQSPVVGRKDEKNVSPLTEEELNLLTQEEGVMLLDDCLQLDGGELLRTAGEASGLSTAELDPLSELNFLVEEDKRKDGPQFQSPMRSGSLDFFCFDAFSTPNRPSRRLPLSGTESAIVSPCRPERLHSFSKISRSFTFSPVPQRTSRGLTEEGPTHKLEFKAPMQESIDGLNPAKRARSTSLTQDPTPEIKEKAQNEEPAQRLNFSSFSIGSKDLLPRIRHRELAKVDYGGPRRKREAEVRRPKLRSKLLQSSRTRASSEDSAPRLEEHIEKENSRAVLTLLPPKRYLIGKSEGTDTFVSLKEINERINSPSVSQH